MIINVKMIDFHITTAYEMVRQNADGSYTILLNSRQAPNQLKKAYLHALEHIRRDDWKKDDVQEIEYEAHKNKNR